MNPLVSKSSWTAALRVVCVHRDGVSCAYYGAPMVDPPHTGDGDGERGATKLPPMRDPYPTD